jgi:hypothetical protein
VVRAIDGYDEAMLNALELKGVYVERVKFTPQKLVAAYENLSLMTRNRVAVSDYSLQILHILSFYA